MLKDCDATAIVAVKDIERARRFYEGVLGLDPIGGEPQDGMASYRTGATRLDVYESEFAGTNKANAVVFTFKDGLEQVVSALQAKNVTFEHYPDLPGLTLNGDIHEMGSAKLVWLKDPDGNILHLNEGM
jgi:catechol 2,3-dioxygenase-like lactoylglutathione lyase family enzyme